MSFFWSLQAGQSAANASASAVRAQGEARKAKTSVDDLQSQLDRTLMACEAMWTILRDKLDVTDLDLLNRINEIDLSDGRLDGKVNKSAVACPKCGRTMARRFAKCMYCGQPVMQDPFM